MQNTTIHPSRRNGHQFPSGAFVTGSPNLSRQKSGPSVSAPRTVLLIEDDAELRSLLNFVFARKGYQVVEAEDGQEGLQTAMTKDFDLILVDFDLPFVHGLEVVRELRQHPKSEALPIIMMTTHGDRVRENAVKAGCDEFLPKPIDFDRLYELMDCFAPAEAAQAA